VFKTFVSISCLGKGGVECFWAMLVLSLVATTLHCRNWR